MKMNGVSGLVRAALWLEDRLNLETQNIGRESLAPSESCLLETTGKWLAYYLTIDGGWLSLKIQLMDTGEEPQLLVSFVDGPEGFREVCKIIRLLEREEVKSLQRPIALGEGSGANSYVIAGWSAQIPNSPVIPTRSASRDGTTVIRFESPKARRGVANAGSLLRPMATTPILMTWSHDGADYGFRGF